MTQSISLAAPERRSARFFSSLRQLNKLTIFSILVLALLALSALFAHWLSPYDPLQMIPRSRLQGPSPTHWFGTDGLGRDVFSRVLHGSRVSLMVGLGVAVVVAIGGVIFGLCAGISRKMDTIVMRVMDGVMAIPGILLAVALVSLVGASLTSIVIAIAIPEVPRVARLLRSVVLSTREEAYVRVAEGLGLPLYRILW